MLRFFEVSYYQIANAANGKRKHYVYQAFREKGRFHFHTMLKILTGRVSVKPVNPFGPTLRRYVREKLRLYVPVAKSRARANFFITNLSEFNHILRPNHEVLQTRKLTRFCSDYLCIMLHVRLSINLFIVISRCDFECVS